MNMVDMKLSKSMTLKEMSKQTEGWTDIIEGTKNEELKKDLEDLSKDSKEIFNSVKLFHSDVQDEFSEYTAENSEYDQAAKLFREIREKIRELEKSGENPDLLEELKIQSAEQRAKCDKEFAEAKKEAFEYVEVKRKMEKMRVDFQDFYETTQLLMEEVKKYNSRYEIPKFRQMDIGHFYKKIHFLKKKLANFKEIIETEERTAEENAQIYAEVYGLITQNRTDLDRVAQILYKRLREKGQEKMTRVSKKLLDVGLKGPLVRQFEANRFDVTLTFSCEDNEMQIEWNAKGLLPKLKSRVSIKNAKRAGQAAEEFENNLANNEDEEELVDKIAKITQKLKD
jgi:hypothetical protein